MTDELDDFEDVREEEVYEDFIIGTEQNGQPTMYTCNHNLLGNRFGANPGAPTYLTPVFFRREVMERYYADPRKYSVEDGYLRCGYSWGAHIDNHRRDFVVVFLGDLGRDIPPVERQHWKQFNVPPEGGLSDVAFRRSMMAEAVDPIIPDLRFQADFEGFRDDWEALLGWNLFRRDDEAGRLAQKSLHIPLSEDRDEFDGQVKALATILIGGLNADELARQIPAPPGGAGPLQLFEAFLAARGLHADDHVNFLRGLETLSGGRRRTREYRKAAEAFGLPERGCVDTFTGMLEQAIAALEFLRKVFLPG